MKAKLRLGALFAIVIMVLSVTMVVVTLVPVSAQYTPGIYGSSHTWPGVKVPDAYGTTNGITWDANSTLMVQGSNTHISWMYLIMHTFLGMSNASIQGNMTALVFGCEELVLATTKQVTVSTIRFASALSMVETAPTQFPTMGAAWDAIAYFEYSVGWPYPLSAPVISVVPSVEKVHCGPTGLSGTAFTINVTVSGLGDTMQGVGAGQAMLAYELRLSFNQSLINVTGADSHGRDLTHQVSAGDGVFPAAYMSPIIKWGTGTTWVPLDNVTLGIVDVGEILTAGATGNGPLMGVIFHIIYDIPLVNVLTPTNKTVGCPLALLTTPLPAGYLYDTQGNVIPCIVNNGFYNYTRAMTVVGAPTASFTVVPSTIYVGSSGTCTSTSTSPSSPIYSWDWEFVSGSATWTTANNATTRTFKCTGAGPLVISLTVKNQAGLSATAQNTVSQLVKPAALIDLYSSNNRFCGQLVPNTNIGLGPNNPCDSLSPGVNVTLYANVTWVGEPLQNVPVAFEVDWQYAWASSVYPYNQTFVEPPGGWNECVTELTAETNANGIAYVFFRVPIPSVGEMFGQWIAIASCKVQDTKIQDTMPFDVAYAVTAISVTTNMPTYGVPGGIINITATVKNIMWIPQTVTLVAVAYDTCDVPIGQAMDIVTVPGGAYNAPYETTYTLSITVPRWAYVGIGTVYLSAWTKLPRLCGVPYCPGVQTSITLVWVGP